MGGGYMNRSLSINLSTGEVEELGVSAEDQRLYLGGKGIATRLLYDHTPPGLDPYDERMALIFSTGPATGTAAPQSNRFVVTTKSPLTGAIANSTCGGDFATKLKRAGVDLVLIKGRAEHPVYLEITEAGAQIKDARSLWGKGTMETQELLPEGFGKAVIGPAGENRVRYACIVSQQRVAGRSGCGAVMGAKNLKAIIADGHREMPIAREQAHRELNSSITRFLRAHPMTGDILPRLGTANIVSTAAGRNILPTFNFQRGTDPRAVEISGEKITAKYLKKRSGCVGCPVSCGRRVKHKGREAKGPEYETLSQLGSNLGNFNLERIFEWNGLCDDLGLDTISTGGAIAFATELTGRGLLESELSFETHDSVGQLIQDIAHRRGTLGAELAEGVRRMSDKYGGKEYAMHVKGLELPGYDPRGCYGQGLEYATTNRGGCHIQGATMYLEATGPLSIDPLSIKSKPELVVLQQNLAAAVCSSIYCMFASFAAVPAAAFKLNPQGTAYHALTAAILNTAGPLLGAAFSLQPADGLRRLAARSPWAQALLGSEPVSLLVNRLKTSASLYWFEQFLSTIIGRPISMLEFTEIGERVFNMERIYNLREGLTEADDTLPPRLLNESTFKGVSGGVPLELMLPRYYQLRGWDLAGRPTAATLQRLGIRK